MDSKQQQDDPGSALMRLDQLAHLLRERCPWDQQQDERSIVPHTLEEAYELADAVHSGDDHKLLDELGDVLFQVVFLSLLMEEREAGNFAQVAEHCRLKLIGRHPHVFGEIQAETAEQVMSNWDGIKQQESGRASELFGDVPEILPAPLFARKLQRRAANRAGYKPALTEQVDALKEALGRVEGAQDDREQGFKTIGELLFNAVDLARALDVDPELALRAAAENFKHKVEREHEQS